MALVSKLDAIRLEIPHEPGEWIKIKKPSQRQLRLAADVLSDHAFARMKKMGADLMEAIRKDTQSARQERDPAQTYDRDTILAGCIVEWSYGEKVTLETVGDLDEETAAWAFEEIMKLVKTREDERKNGSLPSTGHSTETETLPSSGSSPESVQSLDASQAPPTRS